MNGRIVTLLLMALVLCISRAMIRHVDPIEMTPFSWYEALCHMWIGAVMMLAYFDEQARWFAVFCIVAPTMVEIAVVMFSR